MSLKVFDSGKLLLYHIGAHLSAVWQRLTLIFSQVIENIHFFAAQSKKILTLLCAFGCDFWLKRAANVIFFFYADEKIFI